MCSVSAGRPAFFSRPQSRVVFKWTLLQEAAAAQRRYVKSSFEWVQTSGGPQWKSLLPITERKRRLTAVGVAGLQVVIGRDSAYFLAYRTRFEFSESGLAAAIAKARGVRSGKVTRNRDRLRAGTRTAARDASRLLAVIVQCEWCGQDFVRPRHNAKLCSPECYRLTKNKKACDYQRMLKQERRDVVHANRRKYNEKVKACPKRMLRKRLADYVRRYLKGHGTKKGGSVMTYVGCSLDALKSQLETQFQPGMSWENRSEWHVDHVYPLRAVDPHDEFQLYGVCNWRNLRPMWARDNERKHGSVTTETTMAFMGVCKLAAQDRLHGNPGKLGGRGRRPFQAVS